MNISISNFYIKNAEQNYIDAYDRDHGSRLDNLVNRFNLSSIKNASIIDVGGGLGFLGKRLDISNEYIVFDGAIIPDGKELCSMKKFYANLDYDTFSDKLIKKADIAFCLETLEHLSNPYHCLAEIKKMTKDNGDIYISIPTIHVWHNYIYPALMHPKENFEQFLGQMALPIVEYHLWDKNWTAHTWRLRNAPWYESKMLFPKQESKFYGKTPIEYVNL